MPDDTLEREWAECKHFQIEDTALTAREKHLIGLDVAAAIHCPHSTHFHRAAATMMGATEQQAEEAARFASDRAKYGTYLFGPGTDLDAFKARRTRSASTSRGKPGNGARRPDGTGRIPAPAAVGRLGHKGPAGAGSCAGGTHRSVRPAGAVRASFR